MANLGRYGFLHRSAHCTPPHFPVFIPSKQVPMLVAAPRGGGITFTGHRLQRLGQASHFAKEEWDIFAGVGDKFQNSHLLFMCYLCLALVVNMDGGNFYISFPMHKFFLVWN